MSLRQGITQQEEHRLKTLASQGMKWSEVVARCSPTDEKGQPQVPLLDGVNLEKVKKDIWEPLLAKHDEAVEAGFEDIHSHERALATTKAETKRKEAAAEAAGFDSVEDWEDAQEARKKAREEKKKSVKGKGKDAGLDDLLGDKPSKKK